MEYEEEDEGYFPQDTPAEPTNTPNEEYNTTPPSLVYTTLDPNAPYLTTDTVSSYVTATPANVPPFDTHTNFEYATVNDDLPADDDPPEGNPIQTDPVDLDVLLNMVSVTSESYMPPQEPEKTDAKIPLMAKMLPVHIYINRAYNSYCNYLCAVSETELTVPPLKRRPDQNIETVRKNVMKRINRSFYDKKLKIQFKPYGFVDVKYLMYPNVSLGTSYDIKYPHEMAVYFNALRSMSHTLDKELFPILEQIAINKKFIYPIASKTRYVIANIDYDTTHLYTQDMQNVQEMFLQDTDKTNAKQVSLNIKQLLDFISIYNVITERLLISVCGCYEHQTRSIEASQSEINFYKEKDLQNSLYTW